MDARNTPEAEPPPSAKPPRNQWQASEPFIDFKASHLVEIGLTLAIALVGLLQLGVYMRQAKIMKDQTTISTAQTMIAGTQSEISGRQADIMKSQASIATQANFLTESTQRAFVSATGIRVDKQPGEIIGHLGQFEPYLFFYPTLENGGNTPTKNLRISAQAYLDPSRTDVEVKLPLNVGIGPKQSFSVAHLPAAGPPDPQTIFAQSELKEREGKPSTIIRALLGPRVSQTFGGFGVPVEETKRRMQEGERWFVLGSIHYNDRFLELFGENFKILLCRWVFYVRVWRAQLLQRVPALIGTVPMTNARRIAQHMRWRPRGGLRPRCLAYQRHNLRSRRHRVLEIQRSSRRADSLSRPLKEFCFSPLAGCLKIYLLIRHIMIYFVTQRRLTVFHRHFDDYHHSHGGPDHHGFGRRPFRGWLRAAATPTAGKAACSTAAS